MIRTAMPPSTNLKINPNSFSCPLCLIRFFPQALQPFFSEISSPLMKHPVLLPILDDNQFRHSCIIFKLLNIQKKLNQVILTLQFLDKTFKPLPVLQELDQNFIFQMEHPVYSGTIRFSRFYYDIFLFMQVILKPIPSLYVIFDNSSVKKKYFYF